MEFVVFLFFNGRDLIFLLFFIYESFSVAHLFVNIIIVIIDVLGKEAYVLLELVVGLFLF